MRKKACIAVIIFILFFPTFAVSTTLTEGNTTVHYRSVSAYAPAAAQTSQGLKGVASTITVTVQNGSQASGRVFLETMPLTQIDMQGSARLATTVATSMTGISASNYDFFFVVKTPAPVIGGPSASGLMTVATVAALKNWTLDNRTMMTGMINPDGSIGPVGGIVAKLEAVNNVGATRFLIPKGQGVYTEMETVRTIRNVGGRQIIEIKQQPVTRNVADYAMQKYGIEVVEVADINEALRYMTGHRFNITTSDHPITTEDYVTAMSPLASNLLSEANNSYQNASDIFQKTDVPNQYPFYYENQIEDILSSGGTSYELAQQEYEKNHYYASTSKSFQSLISSGFVNYACKYFTADNKDDYLSSLFNKTTNAVDQASKKITTVNITGIISLQCVGAAQKRALEAEERLNAATQDYQDGKTLDALYKLAFALERSKSVGWWINMSSYFEEHGDVNSTVLRDMAEKYLGSAEQARIYSSIIVQEMGKTSSWLSEATTLLQEARSEISKYPAAALFKSLEAQAKANLAIELLDGATQEKIERTKERANAAISGSRKAGIEPILAVSYYEYATTLTNESSSDALGYYKYADIIAGALRFISNPPEEKPSRFVGIPPRYTSSHYWIGGINVKMMYSMIIIGVTCIVIAIILGIGTKPMRKKQKKGFSHHDEIPRSIQRYYEEH